MVSSLLLFCSKIFEWIIYSAMYKYVSDNNLLSPNQSGFRTGDSCINQLLSITHNIYYSLDEGFKTRVIFLDISKAFDKVWHERLIFKLRQYVFPGDLLSLLINFLTNRKQRVGLNGQNLSWADIKAGTLQVFFFVVFFWLFVHKWSDWKLRLKSKAFWRWHILIFHS